MSALLTQEERSAVRRFCPEAGGITKTPGYFDEIPLLVSHAIRPYELSDEDEQAIASLLSKWVGLFPKKPSQLASFRIDDYQEYLFDLCVESGLSVILLKSYFDGLARSHKTLPSISEIAEGLTELKWSAQAQWSAAQQARQGYYEAASKLSETLEAELPSIRAYLPNFPEVRDLKIVWKSLWGGPLGSVGSAELSVQRAAQMSRAVKEGKVWPAILLYLIWLASKIPEEKKGKAGALHDRLCPDDAPKGRHFSPFLFEQVIEQLPAENDLPEYDPLEYWLYDVLHDLNGQRTSSIEAMWHREGGE